MSLIKPIETIYNGYRFRSRLEARWAVFFDSCGIEYEYEPEGYVLCDGSYYLPDFYLPDYELFIEIKPFDKAVVEYVGDGNKWEQKCAKFRDSTSKAILLIYGDPCADIYKLLFAWDTCDSGGGSSEYECKFVETGNKIVVAIPFQRVDREIFVTDFDNLKSNPMVGTTHEFNICDEELFRLYDSRGSDLLNIAKTKSRQVRFEHNEKKY